MADNMPDFDKMSPEEIMAWMETLAKRQGATEGLTTSADVSIAEIDPSTVVIDEPGYVPYDTKIGGSKPAESAPPPAPAQATPSPAPAAQPTPPPPPAASVTPPPTPAREVPPPPPTPARTTPPPTPAREVPPPPAASVTPAPTPAREVPPPPPSPVRDVPPPPAASVTPPPTPPARATQSTPSVPPAPPRSGNMDEGALAWLENLASEQEDSLFNLDLSGAPASGESGQGDSLAWLENLAANTTPELETAAPSTTDDDPLASASNSIAWLEKLAREQGAKPDELTTAEDELGFAVPDFSNLGAELEPLPPQDPSNFLESLASAEGYDEYGVSATRPPAEPEVTEMDQTDLEKAVASGTASREQMQAWLEQKTDQYLESPEIEIDEPDPDAPPVPAELPPWLLESIGAPPAPSAPAPERPSLESLFPEAEDEPPTVPDWLRGDTGSSAAMDMESIFAEDEPTTPTPISVPSLQSSDVDDFIETDEGVEPVGAGDTWAEAFDDEYAQGAVDINTVPDWYQRNLNDPDRLAAVEQMAKSSEPLPEETHLPLGQPQAVPDWMVESVVAPPAPPFEAAPVQNEAMDWMEGLEEAVSPDEIPAWLLETIDEQGEPGGVSGTDILALDLDAEEDFAPPAPEPEPPAPVRATQTQPTTPRPAPTPPPAPVRAPAREDVSLSEARRLAQSGSLAEGLAHYEGLIRAMINVDDVVDDLSSLSRQYRDNPSVFRLLGDGLMRQGKLQAALDTYRQALNQL